MTDVTEYVDRYRLALRHIWNSCFYIDPALRDFEAVYSFRALKRPLFKALVADIIGLEVGSGIFGSEFRVVPSRYDSDELPSLAVNLNVGFAEPGIWDPVKGPFKADEIELTLVDFFDWAPVSYSDLRYYEVLIVSFQKHPEHAGHHALVDVHDARVFWTGGGRL